MSKLGDAQELFSLNLALLILEARRRGHKARVCDVFRDPRVFGELGVRKGYGHPSSSHKLKLAVDLYFDDENAHIELHAWWLKQGGNKMIKGDANHYSWPYGDVI